MILPFCLLALLVATNIGAQRIKGGHSVLREPGAFQGIGHFGKGGGGGSLHHAAIVADPISQGQVLLGSSGLGGLTGLGASSGQFSVDDAQISSFGQRRLYRVGQSQVPFGLSGLDYYSYPKSLLTSRRNFGGKNVFADNISGLSPIGFGRKSAIIADPTTSQFSVGDAQIRSFGGRNLYRSGVSTVPYGLSGLDYYSYPRNLFTQRGGGGLGQTHILSGGGFNEGDSQILSGGEFGAGDSQILTGGGFGAGDSQILTGGGFTAGDSQVSGILTDSVGQNIIQESVAPEQVVIGDGGFGQRQVAVTKSGGLGGLRGGQILLRGGQALGGYRRVKSRPFIQAAAPVENVQVLVDSTSGLGAPFGGFGQRQVAVTKSVAPSPIIQAPIRRVVNRGLGEAFITQAVRPRLAARRVVAVSRPMPQFVSQPSSGAPGNIQFTLGGNQIIGGPIVSAQRPSFAVQRPTFVQRPAVAFQRPIVVQQQPQVISQVKTSGFGGGRVFGRQFPQMYYVDGGSRFPGIDIIGGYRVGDPRYNYGRLPISTQRFANLGLSQAHVSAFSNIDSQGSIDAGPMLVSPAPASSLFSTKSTGGFGGVASPVTKSVVNQGSPFGLAGIGQTSSNVVSQEEVIGPAGERQVVTTVTDAGPSKIGGLATGGALGLSGIGQLGSVSSKIGGLADGGALGLSGIGHIESVPSKIGGLATGGDLGLSGIGQIGSVSSKIGGLADGGALGLSGIGQIGSVSSKIGGLADGGALGLSGIGHIESVPSKIGGLATGGDLGLSGIGQIGGSKIGGLADGGALGLSGIGQIGSTKIGGPVVGGLGLSGIGHTSPGKIVSQEEVIGPAGDSQIVTTITGTGAGSSKIGGQAFGSPFTSAGQAPQVISQQQVVGPAGDTQVITTVSESSPSNMHHVQQEEVGGLSGLSSLTASPLSQIAQDPFGTSLSQETLGDSGLISSGGSALLGSIGQGTVDFMGGGQSQLSVDDVIGQSAISGGGSLAELSQQSIGGGGFSDPFEQQSISSGFGSGLGGYVPRVSFLSQYPYDVPSRTLLRQAVTRPFAQEQQQVEQFLV